MARLLWPKDHEWIYLTVKLLKGEGPPISDVTMRGASRDSDEPSREGRITPHG